MLEYQQINNTQTLTLQRNDDMPKSINTAHIEFSNVMHNLIKVNKNLQQSQVKCH